MRVRADAQPRVDGDAECVTAAEEASRGQDLQAESEHGELFSVKARLMSWLFLSHDQINVFAILKTLLNPQSIDTMRSCLTGGVFLKMGHSRTLFLYFRFFKHSLAINNKLYMKNSR